MLIPKKFGLKATAAQPHFPMVCPCRPPPEASQRSPPCQRGGRTGVHESPIFGPVSVYRSCKDGESAEPPCSRCSAALQCHHRRAAVHAAGSPGRERGAARSPGAGAAGGAGALRQAPLPRAGKWGQDRTGREPLLRGCGPLSEAVLLAQSSGRHQQGDGRGVDGLTWLETSLGHEPGFIHTGFDVVRGGPGPRSRQHAAALAASHPSFLRALLCKPLTVPPGTAHTQCLDQTGPPAPKSMKILFLFSVGSHCISMPAPAALILCSPDHQVHLPRRRSQQNPRHGSWGTADAQTWPKSNIPRE